MTIKHSVAVLRSITTISLAFWLCLGGTTASAQTVYETRGANGPVFSDKPQPGAKAIQLKPLNVIENSVLTGNKAAEKGAAPTSVGSEKPLGEPSASSNNGAATYRAFAIAFPENDGSVVANGGTFEVRVAPAPALRLGDGHAFAVSINGRPVAQRFTASEFMIPPEFWGDQLPPPNQRAQLAAAIVDRNGAVLKEAAPVQFLLRYTTVLQRPHPLKPQAKPVQQTTPKAQPEAVIRALPVPKN